MEEEAIGDDDAEVTVNKVEEEMIVRILTKDALIYVMQLVHYTVKHLDTDVNGDNKSSQ